jgi:hypothetical protein
MHTMPTSSASKTPPWMVSALVGVLTAFFLVGGVAAIAAEPIIKIDPGTEVPNRYEGFDEAHGYGMVGWTFQLLTPITITQAGWFAQNTDGLSRDFQIGLWKGLGLGSGRLFSNIPSSLIGDPHSGLIIPAGTNASRVGAWRVVELDKPITLDPGFYELGGWDTPTTSDVIKFVLLAGPGTAQLQPPGSPLAIGSFFWSSMSLMTSFGPTTQFYLERGLELGPMLFWTNGAPDGEGLSIRLDRSVSPHPAVFITWPSGTLMQADAVSGPFTSVTNAVSPYTVPSLSIQKFYRLHP